MLKLEERVDDVVEAADEAEETLPQRRLERINDDDCRAAEAEKGQSELD